MGPVPVVTTAGHGFGSSDVEPDRPWSALRAYYEREAELGTRTELRGRRVELRTSFIAALVSEQRRSVVDFGAGPGLDGVGFTEAGLRYLGIDLAVGNARRARDRTLTVVAASIDAPPVRSRSFAAGWSMSTLMHLPLEAAATAVEAMAACLEPGAPLQVGTWGGPERTEVEESGNDGGRRRFHLRPVATNQQLLACAGTIESVDVWAVGPDGWEYHVIRARVGG